MDSNGLTFIDYALPDWASADQVFTTLALGEEGGSELVGWEDLDSGFGNGNGAEGAAPSELDWTVTTLAFGEETGDAGNSILVYIRLQVETTFGMIIEIDPVTRNEVIACGDWSGFDNTDKGVPADDPVSVGAVGNGNTTPSAGETNSFFPAEPQLIECWGPEVFIHPGPPSMDDLSARIDEPLVPIVDPTIIDCTGGLLPPVPPPTGEPSEHPVEPMDPTDPVTGGIDPIDPSVVICPPSEPTEPPTDSVTTSNLAITQLTAAGVATAGDPFNVSWTYSFSGTTPLTFAASLCVVTYSRNDVLGDEDDMYLAALYGSYDWSNPSPLDSVTSNQAIFIPAACVGVGHLFFSQDGFNYLEESDETDNTLMRDIEVVLPNLSLSAAQAPSQAVSGDQIDVSWTVANLSDLALSGPYYHNTIVFSSNDVYGDTDDVQIFVHYPSSFDGTGPMQSQEIKTYHQTFNLPGSVSGDGYLFFALDVANDLTESDESDNLLMQAFSILQPDLAIENVFAPETATSGDQIQVSWSIANQSDLIVASVNNFDSVILSVNDIYGDEDDIFLANSLSFHPIQLDPSGQETFTHKILLPNNFVGNGYLFFKIDSGGLISETNEANNIFAHQIAIVKQNLTIASLTSPTTAEAGSFVDITIAIRNDGEAVLNSFNPNQIVFSTNEILGDDDDSYVFSQGPSFPYPILGKPHVIGSEVPSFWRCGTVAMPDTFVPLNLQSGDSQTISLPVYLPSYFSGGGFLLVSTASGSVASTPISITPQPAIEEFDSYWLRSTRELISISATMQTAPLQVMRALNTVVLTSELNQLGSLGITSTSQLASLTDNVVLPISASYVVTPASSPSTPVQPIKDGRLPSLGSTDASVIPSQRRFASVFIADALKSAPRAPVSSTPEPVAPDGWSYLQAAPSGSSAASALSRSLMQRTGVTPQGSTDVPSRDVFVKDPLSGLKVGELTPAS